MFRRSQPDPKDLAMRQVLSVKGTRRFPTWRQWGQLSRVVTRGERTLLAVSLGVFILSSITIGLWFASTHQVETPAQGGTYTEALVGGPQFINPLYASESDVDADLTRLVFSGILRFDPTTGFANDLAAKTDIAADAKTYTITLRDDARFHDGTPVRARDVVFTFASIQNPAYRSPLNPEFQGITVSQTDDHTVVFSLEKPSPTFLSNLTVGILPADVWSEIPARNVPLASRNLEPVGSGPFRFKEFAKDKKGDILSYTLERNGDYYGDKALLDTITFKFYADARGAMAALDNRNVEGAAFIPPEFEVAVSGNRAVHVLRPTMPRAMTLYFNQVKSVSLKNADVRKAIALAIDKNAVLEKAVNGHGQVIQGPILPDAPGFANDLPTIGFDPTAANDLLEKAGFKKPEGSEFRVVPKDSTNPPLSVIITTVEQPEFVHAAEQIAANLKAIGIKADVRAVSPGDLFPTVVEPREYEMLLTATLVRPDADLYPFWHSSQATGKGLNLALYANKKADVALEAARVAVTGDDRAQKLREFQVEVANDIPAIFLYQSTYAYALGAKIKGASIERIGTPADRFARVTEWYVKTKKVLR